MFRHRWLILAFGACVVPPAWAQTAPTPLSSTTWDWLTIPWAISTAIALVALFRPNIERAFRRWRNRVDLFPQKHLQIGFSHFGPVISLVGSLTGAPSDQFVRSISIKLVRVRDTMTHSFEWVALRPVTLAQMDEKDMKVAMGFKLPSGDSIPINVAFVDDETKQRVEEHLVVLRDAWYAHRRTINVLAGNIDFRQEFSSFGKGNRVVSDCYAAVDRLFYWDEGEYRIAVTVSTWNPKLDFPFRYKFALSKQQSVDLRMGVLGAMHAICEMPDGAGRFVNPTLVEDK